MFPPRAHRQTYQRPHEKQQLPSLHGGIPLSPVCAIVESAKAIGLASTEFKNPAKTTSYGVGVIIDDALMRTKDIVLALGGSSTNDGGAGIAAALGVKFFDKSGETFIPTGGTLKNIEKST